MSAIHKPLGLRELTVWFLALLGIAIRRVFLFALPLIVLIVLLMVL